MVTAQSDSIIFRTNGFVDSYYALRSQSPNNWMSSRTRLRSELTAEKGSSSIFVSFDAIYNGIMNDKTELYLREAFSGITQINYPAKNLSTMEFGRRLSMFLTGIDISIAALHTWNKMPVINKTLSPTMDRIYLTVHSGRFDMLGADMSVPIGKFVFRTEAAAYLGELQELDMPVQTDTFLKENSYNALIGLDFYASVFT